MASVVVAVVVTAMRQAGLLNAAVTVAAASSFFATQHKRVLPSRPRWGTKPSSPLIPLVLVTGRYLPESPTCATWLSVVVAVVEPTAVVAVARVDCAPQPHLR